MLGSDATARRVSTEAQNHNILRAPLRLVRLCHTAETATPNDKAATRLRSTTAVAPLTWMKVAVPVVQMGGPPGVAMEQPAVL